MNARHKVTVGLNTLQRARLDAVLARTGQTVQSFCAEAIDRLTDAALDPSPPGITLAEIAAENSIWLRAFISYLYCTDDDAEAMREKASKVTEELRSERHWPALREHPSAALFDRAGC